MAFGLMARLEEYYKTDEGREISRQLAIDEGIEIGTLRRDIQFVKSLLTATEFGDEKIASIASVEIGFVEMIRSELAENK